MAGRDSDSVFPDDRNVVLTNYGRTAFEAVLRLRELRGSTVLFPALLCRDGFERIAREYDLTPVFVDVDPRTYHADFGQARRAARKADAAVLVHAFGVPADGDRWRALAAERDLTVIEDCARALGASVNGRPVGSVGEFAIYSLRKVSPARQGGALATAVDPDRIDLGAPTYDPTDAYALLPERQRRSLERAYAATNTISSVLNTVQFFSGTQTVSDSGAEAAPEPRGLDLINAAAFCTYLLRGLDERIERNVAAARRIRSRLEPLGFEFQAMRGTSPRHFLAMEVPGDRDAMVDRLRDAGIVARTFWDPPLVAAYERLSAYPNAERVATNGLQLPLVEMTDAEVRTALDVLIEAAPDGG